MKARSLVLILLMLLSVPALAQQVPTPNTGGGGTTVDPRPWPGRVWNEVFNEFDHSGTQVTNLLFDLIDEFDVTAYKSDSGKTKAKLGVKRTVFDNQDVLSTWTVFDQFSIDLSRYGTDLSFPLAPNVTTPVNFNVGVGGQLLVTHVRQIPSWEYYVLPSTEELKREAEENEQALLERKRNRWYEFDPSIRPRLHSFFNPLLNLYRIPWTKQGLKKLKNWELISWSANGYVNVGLEAGLLPLKIQKEVDLSLGVGIQSFLKGEFRITLLKEDDRFVRVKLTKVRAYGGGITVGAQTNEIETFEGFLLFEGKDLETRVLEHKLTVVPFKFGYERENKKQWDIGYRFDLEDPEAEEAFESAMRGNFFWAEQLSQTGDKVKSILTRESFEKRKTSAYRLGVKWLYQGGRKREKKDLWVTIERPEGKKDIFKSSLGLSRGWSNVLGNGEKNDFTFTTVFDETGYLKNEENSFQLISEGLVEDVRTSGREMHRYIQDVESVIGDEDILPELPLLVPREDEEKYKEAQYNRSSFYFGQFFSQQQVIKFITTPRDEAWEITQQSFRNLKNKARAKRKAKSFFKDWMKVQEMYRPGLPPEEMVELLQKLRLLFRHHSSLISAMRVPLLSLGGEEIDFFVTATNKSFGRIQFRGRIPTNAERLLQLADETVNFEALVGNSKINLEAQIKDFKVTALSSEEIQISFDLPKNPNFLYFRVLRTSGWKRVRTMKDLIYVNKGRFKEGSNVWVIGRDSTDRLEKELFSAFEKTDFYTFQLSASPDKNSWGRVESVRFKYTAPPKPEEAEED